ncbi:tyrosine-type recombinase/integrase [Mesorhizobium sp. M1233]|uniref:tyrosine-type recombinase/integrase n=1 Tax=Mesorhizobium sp. M1233 TaxID=2957072 RepID=UPI003335AC58
MKGSLDPRARPDRRGAGNREDGQDAGGLRDHAILQILAAYGLRAGEIRTVRIEDIDWRTEVIRVRHSKTQSCSFLPLIDPVGEAVLAYLRYGRPCDRSQGNLRPHARAPIARSTLLTTTRRPI